MVDEAKHSWMVVGAGYWGRGPTVAEAAKRASKEDSRGSADVILYLILGDDEPYVTGGGFVSCLSDGCMFRIGRCKMSAALKMESEAIIKLKAEPETILPKKPATAGTIGKG